MPSSLVLSALNAINAVASADKRVDILEALLTFWTALVALGLLYEYGYDIKVFENFKSPFSRWIHRLTHLGAILVTVGVTGELYVEVVSSIAQERLRSFNKSVIADLNKEASDAIERSEQLRKGNLVLQTNLLTLRQESEARRLTGAQRTMLVRLLNGTHGAVVIVSRLIDPESSDFADDFNVALHDGAHWDTLRVVNRISRRYGVSLGTVAGTIFSPEARRLDEALTAIGIVHDNPTFVDGDASTDPHFQPRILYLVIEQKPLPTSPQGR